MEKPTPWSRCTVQKRSGHFCDGPTMPGSPFPICLRHAAEITHYVHGLVNERLDGDDAPVRDAADLFAKFNTLLVPIGVTPVKGPKIVPTVYYMQVSGLIKIGYSGNLRRRVETYPPNSELLAVEPGDHGLEHRRHLQFAHLLIHGKEWFRDEPEIRAFIATVRAEHGDLLAA